MHGPVCPAAHAHAHSQSAISNGRNDPPLPPYTGETAADVATWGKLKEHARAVSQEKAELQQRFDELQMFCLRAQDEADKLELQIAEAEQAAESSTDPEHAVKPMDVASAQLLDAVAEADAIDELLHHMSKALDSGVMSADEFCREARRQCRRQFECRAIAAKVYAAQKAVYGAPVNPLAHARAHSGSTASAAVHHAVPAPAASSAAEGWTVVDRAPAPAAGRAYPMVPT